MKVLDIALKDLRRSFLSAFLLVFGFVLPLLTAALFYFAFGGLAGGDEGSFDLPVTRVLVVNLDEAQMGISVGGTLVDTLQNAIPGVIEVAEAPDAEAARAAVDRQEAAVAVIIPADLSAAVSEPGASSSVEVYQDPTLTLGPGIVKGIVSGIVDGFAGSKTVVQVASEQLAEEGYQVDLPTRAKLAMQYGMWSAKLGASFQGEENPLFEIQSPAGPETRETSAMEEIVGQIIAGMMVFYVFFTGATSALNILQEDEAGTLPRLFTTPTPQATILGGKLAATFVLLTIQVVVLVIASILIFDVYWGEPLPVALAALGLIVLSASFGIFITSLVKDSRQAGIVYGGVMTVLGMVGLISVFTAGVPDVADKVGVAALVTPQGWSLRAWQFAMDGAAMGDLLLTVAVTLVAGAVFFALGVYRFSKRFA
jgi:ABC-2 type transport system permease protein